MNFSFAMFTIILATSITLTTTCALPRPALNKLTQSSSAVAQSSQIVLCIPGQCLQGFSNTTSMFLNSFVYRCISHLPPTVGAALSAPGAATAIHLLPGQYATDTSPQLLHDLLTSSSASLLPSPGFNASLTPLPLNLALAPGLVTFPSTFYAGNATFTPAQLTTSNSSTPLTAKSLTLSPNVWIVLRSSSSSNTTNRIIIWDSVPDISQLPPSSSGGLTLVDMQSSTCSPPCAASAFCTAAGTCACAPGFTGASCEACASGFFGPQCQKCPDGCKECDGGINGSGRCLKPSVSNDPTTCGCTNGVCTTGGQCTCTAGFIKGDDGTQCARCADGFFLTSTGDCKGGSLFYLILSALSSDPHSIPQSANSGAHSAPPPQVYAPPASPASPKTQTTKQSATRPHPSPPQAPCVLTVASATARRVHHVLLRARRARGRTTVIVLFVEGGSICLMEGV